MEIAVIGDEKFTLGFRLAGIMNVMEFTKEQDVLELMKNDTLAIAVIDQATFQGLSENLRTDITNSNKPVWVIISDSPQEELRKMIIRSIGVDLLKED